MADDALSSAELETLLSGNRPPSDVPRERSATEPPAAACPQTPPPAQPPLRLNDELKRALTALHERLGEQFAADLAALVRRDAQIKLLGIAPTSYRDFIARLDNPTCFNLLSHAPAATPWLLEISPAILFPMIDYMLGGRRAGETIAARPLTDIERRLAARVTGLFVIRLAEAWKEVADFELAFERVECNPVRAAAMKADEALIWLRFELAAGPARGTLNLAIPAGAATALAPQPAEPENPDPEPAPPPATVELVARLAPSKVTALDAAELRAGDMITTEQRIDAPIAVLQDGEVRFHARVGVVGKHKAVQIEKVVPRPGDATDETN